MSIKAPQCPQCGTIGKLAARFCDACGTPLTEESRKGLESKEREAKESEDYERLVARLKTDLGLA